MKIFYCIISLLIAVALVVFLSGAWFPGIPPVGSFLSPQHGFWQNAEPVNKNHSGTYNLKGVKNEVSVYLDDRLVPHIEAQTDEDAYFVQGFLHAKYRLWQMEFQTFAASGRLSEIVGGATLEYDKGIRRKGMVYAAENLLKEIESNPVSKKMADHYTAGVNAYISQLKASNLPVEYKLLNYKPERWSNFKTALFIKQMADNLSGGADDIRMTQARAYFGEEKMKVLFPQWQDSLDPIITKGTVYPAPTVVPVRPDNVDAEYLKLYDVTVDSAVVEALMPNPANGSNSWAVSGSKTASGSPILANDPHLGLNLPAIWYEMQITTPEWNAYGVSFPGAPGVIIGFNEHTAFGFTNSSRDVKDFYTVRYRDDSRKEYWFENEWKSLDLRVEIHRVRESAIVYDTVAYTHWGPVMYDRAYPLAKDNQQALAVRWKGHDASNELLMWYYLNRAVTVDDYEQAIQYFSNPAQNITFATRSGDIAMWQQGQMPALWNRQGVYIMPGEDKKYEWQRLIPVLENPHEINPGRAYISSANQQPADSAYPYFMPGNSFDLYRGIAINRRLDTMQSITPEDMMALQTDNYNVMAAWLRPLLLKHIQSDHFTAIERRYLDIVGGWSLHNHASEKGATIFEVWLDNLQKQIWEDEFTKAGIEKLRPSSITLSTLLLRDTGFAFIDNINTPEVETIADVVTNAFKAAVPVVDSLNSSYALEWGKYKPTTIQYLLPVEKFKSFSRSDLELGGGKHIINAMQQDHGPSWRMVVHLTEVPEAFVAYPGGQSGNPGSRHYDQFVGKWAEGEYYKVNFLRNGGDKSWQKWTILFKH